MSSHAQMQPEGRLLSDDGLAAPAPALPGVAWRIDDAPVPYEAAVAAMEAQVAAIRAGTAPELIWLLQHPPLHPLRRRSRTRRWRQQQPPRSHRRRPTSSG